MKNINKISCKIQKSVILSEGNDSVNIEIGATATLDKDDSPKEIYNQLKSFILDQLNENNGNGNNKLDNNINNAMLNKSKVKPENIFDPEIPAKPINNNFSSKIFNCPDCDEEMHGVKGKNYLMCTKHWAYPDMLEKGQVRDRKF